MQKNSLFLGYVLPSTFIYMFKENTAMTPSFLLGQGTSLHWLAYQEKIRLIKVFISR